MQQPNPINFLRTNFESIIRKAASRTQPEKLEDTDSWLRCLTGLPHPLANIVVVLSGATDAYTALLEEVETISVEQGIPLAMLLFGDVTPQAFASIAEDRQWVLLDKMPGMWMEIPEGFSAGPFAPGVEVRHANDAAGLEAATRMLTEGYPIPLEVSDFFMRGIHIEGEQSGGKLANFVATLDGQPAACSSVCIEDGVAGVYCVATLESARGHGLGTAVTRAAVEYGRRNGATHAMLHATAMGEPIYRKIGFAEQCRIPVYGYGLG